jgi:predicted PolB exonuclease-like 3'-5' exonuclease
LFISAKYLLVEANDERVTQQPLKNTPHAGRREERDGAGANGSTNAPICIGALIAHLEADRWIVDALGAPHIGERSEKVLISSFVARIAELSPQLVTFNGNSFDLPVLMVHGVSAPGLSARPYFHRYTDDAVDLCDVFSSFSPQGKATLHEISRVMGLPGKPKGFDGSEVERYFREGKIKEVAEYCETDVVGTYQVWLRYELFRGTLSQGAFETSQRNLRDFINRR